VAGLALETHTKMLAERLSVVLEVLYAPQNYEGKYTSKSGREEGEVRVRYNQFRVPLMARYTIKKGSIQPYLAAGISMAYAVNFSEEYRFRFTSSSNPNYTAWQTLFFNPVPENNTRRLEQGLLFGLGARTARAQGRNLGIEARAEFTNGFSELAGVSTTFDRFFLLLRYDLTK
jgi:hypothetical protein